MTLDDVVKVVPNVGVLPNIPILLTKEQKQTLEALISDKVREGKIEELKDLLDNDTKGEMCICQLADVKICDHNWSLCNEIRDRLTELKKGKL